MEDNTISQDFQIFLDEDYLTGQSLAQGIVPDCAAALDVLEDVCERAARSGITIEDADRLEEGDIKVEYHSNSDRAYRIIPHLLYQHPAKGSPGTQVEREPWREICETQDNFKLAEFILEAALNEDLTTRLFKIINRIRDGSSDLTYRSSHELNDIWKLASATDIPVSITNPLPEVQALKYG